MGKTTETTTRQEQERSLTLAPQSDLERFLERQVPGFISGLQGLAGRSGAFANRLESLAGGLMSDFRGLPGAVDIAGFMMGGATPEQRAFLDQRSREMTRGARGVFEQDLRDIFEAAGGASRASVGAAGLGGTFSGVSGREAGRLGSRAAAEFGRGAADIRAGLGGQIGGGLLTVNQATLGNLYNLSNAILGQRGQAGQFTGAASDIGARELGRLSNLRVASGTERGSSFGRSTTEESGFGSWFPMALQGLQALQGTAALAGVAGVGPFAGLAGGGAPGFQGAPPIQPMQPMSGGYRPPYPGY